MKNEKIRKMEKKHGHIISLMLMLLLLVPGAARAQFNFDVTSTEALIDDHKRIRSALIARAAVENANMILHDNCKAANVGFDSLNVKLDRYTRCFDLIDLIYTSGKTVFNVKNTYDDVKNMMTTLSDLNQRFVDKCVSKGNIVSSDSIVINTYARMVVHITGDAEDLIQSLYDLALYMTGKPLGCSTFKLMSILNEINDSLDDIRLTVHRAYRVLWKYITIRTTYWKAELYRAKTISQICREAVQRWVDARAECFDGPVVPLEERKKTMYGVE